ncbi:pirin family protein [Winogradskyella sp.]|uniref:pirin family protein n=1 Tax=Winogradskyella sp. TaxID=1883156 RepID=UPI0026344E7A|nr:pirin family protein [Winogradskyella sp.]
MANNKLLVNERQADLGQFMVGRLLPFRKKRQVGPFTFIDHMGPAVLGDGKYMDVDQHPHIGLSTLTYLFKGEIEHRDSIGSVKLITPGDVGFMTAGHGVTHTERTPQFRRTSDTFEMHGYQIWVALPKDREAIDPNFQFFDKTQLPEWKDGDLTIKLVAGNAFGKSSPLQGYSQLFMVDIYAEKETTLDLANQLKGEVAFVIVEGEITEKDHKVEAGQMLISKTDEQCSICLDSGTRLLLFGGLPLEDEHYLLWNFVSSSKEKLQEAKVRWQNKAFPKVPNDDTYIPIPEPRRK